MPRDIDHRSPERVARKSKIGPRRVNLANARRLSIEFDTFETPNESEIRKLKPGDFVKLARNGERFWVQVSGFIGRRWHGIIVNKLLRIEDLSAGDSIFFMRKNIYDLKRGIR